MAITYRTGTHKDISDIAHYLHRSSGGISDYLLDDIVTDAEVKEFIALAVADETTNVFYKNTIVADDGGNIQGMINFYPTDKHVIPDIMYSFLDEEKVATIAPIFEHLPANSIYIYSLACNPNYGKNNAFAGLMVRAFKYAKQNGYEHVCAHVWPDNKKFLDFLLKAGGEIYKKVPIKPEAMFNYQQEIYLLTHNIQSRSRCA